MSTNKIDISIWENILTINIFYTLNDYILSSSEYWRKAYLCIYFKNQFVFFNDNILNISTICFKVLCKTILGNKLYSMSYKIMLMLPGIKSTTKKEIYWNGN